MPEKEFNSSQQDLNSRAANESATPQPEKPNIKKSGRLSPTALLVTILLVVVVAGTIGAVYYWLTFSDHESTTIAGQQTGTDSLVEVQIDFEGKDFSYEVLDPQAEDKIIRNDNGVELVQQGYLDV